MSVTVMQNDEKLMDLIESIAVGVVELKQDMSIVKKDMSGLQKEVYEVRQEVDGITQNIFDLKTRAEKTERLITDAVIPQMNFLAEGQNAVQEQVYNMRRGYGKPFLTK
jgi:predicted  nucleic acid-binding Zn-ribbon protein